MAERYNRDGFSLFDYDVYAIMGDGCMMEDISNEAPIRPSPIIPNCITWPLAMLDSRSVRRINLCSGWDRSQSREQRRCRERSWRLAASSGSGQHKVNSSLAAHDDQRFMLMEKAFGPTDPEGRSANDGTGTYADVVERLFAEFEDRYALSTIVAMVQECRAQLSSSPATAMPELLERLARQRLRTGQVEDWVRADAR